MIEILVKYRCKERFIDGKLVFLMLSVYQLAPQEDLIPTWVSNLLHYGSLKGKMKVDGKETLMG